MKTRDLILSVVLIMAASIGISAQAKAEGEILGGKYDTMFTGRFAYVKSKSKKDKQAYDTWLPKCMAIMKQASVKNPVLIDAALEDQPGHEHEMQCVGVDGSIMTASFRAILSGVNRHFAATA